MTKSEFNSLNRKPHRYLGLFIGIQFLFWTAGGLYFAFSDMDEIHGDHHRKHTSMTNYDSQVSPTHVLNTRKETYTIDSLESFKLIQILDKSVYQIVFITSTWTICKWLSWPMLEQENYFLPSPKSKRLLLHN